MKPKCQWARLYGGGGVKGLFYFNCQFLFNIWLDSNVINIERLYLGTQKKAHPGMTYFVAPDDLPSLLRPTQRKAPLNIHVYSLACVADTKKSFKEFVVAACRRGATVVCNDTGETFRKGSAKIGELVAAWKAARRCGAGKAGGDRKGDNGAKRFWEGFNKIVDRWHLPSKPPNINKKLLKEAGVSRNTIVNYTGYTRLEWRKLTEKKRNEVMKRIERELRNAGRI